MKVDSQNSMPRQISYKVDHGNNRTSYFRRKDGSNGRSPFADAIASNRRHGATPDSGQRTLNVSSGGPSAGHWVSSDHGAQNYQAQFSEQLINGEVWEKITYSPLSNTLAKESLFDDDAVIFPTDRPLAGSPLDAASQQAKIDLDLKNVLPATSTENTNAVAPVVPETPQGLFPEQANSALTPSGSVQSVSSPMERPVTLHENFKENLQEDTVSDFGTKDDKDIDEAENTSEKEKILKAPESMASSVEPIMSTQPSAPKILVVDSRFSEPESREEVRSQHGYHVTQILKSQLEGHGVQTQIVQEDQLEANGTQAQIVQVELSDIERFEYVDELLKNAEEVGGYDYLNLSFGPSYTLNRNDGSIQSGIQVSDLIRQHNERVLNSGEEGELIPESSVNSLTDEQKISLLEGYIDDQGFASGDPQIAWLITESLANGSQVYNAGANVDAQDVYSLFDGYNSQYPGKFYTVGALSAEVSDHQGNVRPENLNPVDLVSTHYPNNVFEPTGTYGVDVYANGVYETSAGKIRGTSFASPEALANAIVGRLR